MKTNTHPHINDYTVVQWLPRIYTMYINSNSENSQKIYRATIDAMINCDINFGTETAEKIELENILIRKFKREGWVNGTLQAD